MKDEKVLSNEELMEITAGFAENKIFKSINKPIAKYGIRPRPTLRYGINPEISVLYAVSPTFERE